MTIRVSIPRNPPTLGLPAIIQQLNSKTATDEDRRAIFSLTFHLTKTHCIWNSSNFLFQRSSFCFCCLFSSLCNSAALRICGSVWFRAHTNTDVQGKTSTKHSHCIREFAIYWIIRLCRRCVCEFRVYFGSVLANAHNIRGTTFPSATVLKCFLCVIFIETPSKRNQMASLIHDDQSKIFRTFWVWHVQVSSKPILIVV